MCPETSCAKYWVPNPIRLEASPPVNCVNIPIFVEGFSRAERPLLDGYFDYFAFRESLHQNPAHPFYHNPKHLNSASRKPEVEALVVYVSSHEPYESTGLGPVEFDTLLI